MSTPGYGDTLSKEGAIKLAAKIHEYWKGKVAVRVDREKSGVYVIRSNLLRGLVRDGLYNYHQGNRDTIWINGKRTPGAEEKPKAYKDKASDLPAFEE